MKKQWISWKKSCKGGAFGDTQSTILALKAIVEYDKLYTAKGDGCVKIKINGKVVQEKFFREQNAEGVVTFDDFSNHLKGGDQKLEVVLEGDASNVGYSYLIDYNMLKPDNDPTCAVSLKTKLSTTGMIEGNGSEIFVTMKNNDEKNGQPMTLAIVGLPGGLEPRHEQLRELVSSGTIDFYEVLGREVAIYLREMGPGQEVNFKIDVLARIPGSYTGPASRIYLYYTNESKFWNDPLSVNIKPAQ